MKLPINEIICGAMPEATKGFPDGSINCCISSPPYWALRDYGTATWEGGNPDCDHKAAKKKSRYDYSMANSKIQDGTRTGTDAPKWKDICPTCGAKKVDKQLGLEKTFEEYIDKLCTIYDEVKRVLRPDGTCWVNLGDTYGSGSRTTNCAQTISGGKVRGQPLKDRPNIGYDKCLLLIPQRFAIEMVNRGWILRNVIIWHKPNPMPSSAKDRFTVDFEYVYFFVKSRKYWFEPQYEPHKDTNETRFDAIKRHGTATGPNVTNRNTPHAMRHDSKGLLGVGTTFGNFNPLGRNRRTVFTEQEQYATIKEDLPDETKQYVITELIKRGIL